METKKSKSGLIAAIILAVILIAAVGACVFLMIQKGEKKLSSTPHEAATVDTDQQQTEYQDVEKELEGFTLGGTEESKDDSDKKDADDKKDTDDKKDSDKKDSDKKDSDEKDAKDDSKEEYLCDYSASRIMTEDDVKELEAGTYENLPSGKNIIRMVINEMYARYGYEFSNQEIADYFGAKEWYQKITDRSTDMNAIYDNMTDTEQANIDFLNEYSE